MTVVCRKGFLGEIYEMALMTSEISTGNPVFEAGEMSDYPGG